MEKLKQIYQRHKEMILYLVFGALTTLVGWATYFLILLSGKMIFNIQTEDTTSGAYMVIYTAAQIIQWLAAVLFAFFTNRKYVFNADGENRSTWRQLSIFACGRVATFFVDYFVTFFGTLALASLIPAFSRLPLFGRTWNLNEIAAKFVAAVIVVIANYFFSKFLVFKKKTE